MEILEISEATTYFKVLFREIRLLNDWLNDVMRTPVDSAIRVDLFPSTKFHSIYSILSMLLSYDV